MPSRSAPALDLLQVFKALPEGYLLLSPELEILAVTDSYLRVSLTKRERMEGRHILEVFTGQQGSPEAVTLKQLEHSLQQVLLTKQPHPMLVQRYYLPDPERPGHLLERYWKFLNTPVLDKTGAVCCILHKLEEVSELVKQGHKAKQTGEKLLEEHRRLQEAQALGHIGSFERNINEDIVYCSDELYRIHGLQPQSEDMTSEKIIAFVHPQEQAQFREAIHQSHLQDKPVDLIQRIVWRDGTIRYVHRRAALIRDEQGKAIKIYGTVQDITEQIEAGEKLRKREVLFREAEAAGDTGSYEGDLSTMQFRFSDNMFRLLGYAPHSVEPTLDLIDSISHPEDATAVRQIIERATQLKQPYQYLRRIYWPDGQLRYLSSHGKVVCDEAGQAVKIVGTVQDITELKKAQAKLEESQQQLSAVLDASTNSIQAFKAIRDEENQIVDFEWIFLNQIIDRYRVKQSYPKDQPNTRELVGQRLLEHYPSSKKVITFQQFRQVVESGQTADFEVFYDYEGFSHWFHILAVKFDDGLVATFQDITERKHREAERFKAELHQQRERLELALEAQETERKRIAEGLHDGVGQLLYAIQLQLSRLNFEPDFEDQCKGDQTTISPLSLNAWQAAKQKTERLLQQTIEEVRHVSYQLMPALLENFGLSQAMQDFCKRFAHSGLALTCHGLDIRLDAYLEITIYRIAQELVNNIVKHAAASQASIEVTQEGDWILIEAKDNGKGFTTKRGQRKGIGLQSIKDRVKLLGGTIELTSAPGQGSLIWIRLPIFKKGHLPA